MFFAEFDRTEPLQFVLADDRENGVRRPRFNALGHDEREESARGSLTGSRDRSWNLGNLEMLCLNLACASRTPFAECADKSVFLNLVTGGSLNLKKGGRLFDLQEGGMVLADAAWLHCCNFSGKTKLISLRIPKLLLREKGFRLDLHDPVLPDVASPDAQAISDLIRTIAQQEGKTSERFRCRQGEQLLDLMDIVLNDLCTLACTRSGAAALLRAKRFIGRHFRDANLTATLIASSVNVSEAHLNRLFRAEGLSIMRYVWSRRLEHAARLLSGCANREMQIRDIAYRCGFATHAHFSRTFRSKYGMSPRDATAVDLTVKQGASEADFTSGTVNAL